MNSPQARLRQAGTIVAYWRGSRLVLQNYRTRRSITAHPLTVSVLDFFSRWRPAASFYASRSFGAHYSRSSLRRALEQLLDRGFLLVEKSAEARADERFTATWSSWLPEAGFFHFSTRDVPYLMDNVAARRILRRRAAHIPVPAPFKRYPGAAQVSLPPPRRDGELPRVLLARRSWRAFSKASIDLADLSTLLGLTWGVQWWVPLGTLGTVALKTSPSAGARHPGEVYVLACRVRGLPPGLYHYRADTHRLERVRRGANARQLVTYLAGQYWFRDAAALTLMTAVFPRSHWKYRDPAAYRTVVLDAGHLCQTFCLVATWLGLAPFCTMALKDTLVERHLGIDGVTEATLYAAGVGVPPPNKDWAPDARVTRFPTRLGGLLSAVSVP
jgi:SagB-type dehydrogenase family enzyme